MQSTIEMEMQISGKGDIIKQILQRHLFIHIGKKVNKYPASQNQV